MATRVPTAPGTQMTAHPDPGRLRRERQPLTPARTGTGAAATVAVVAMFKARAAAGIVGPVVFTGAWLASSLLQTGYSPTDLQISGLAAPDARDPWIMITGFLALGGCTVMFGEALNEALAEGKGCAVTGMAAARGDLAGLAPRLIQGAGVLTIAAGLLRRDHMLLVPGAVSWHNHAHDVVSVVLYVDLVFAQFLLARGLGRKPGWKPWRPWLLASAAATAAVLIAFAGDISAPTAGILQRVAVTIPLGAIAAIAARLLRIPATAGLAVSRRRQSSRSVSSARACPSDVSAETASRLRPVAGRVAGTRRRCRSARAKPCRGAGPADPNRPSGSVSQVCGRRLPTGPWGWLLRVGCPAATRRPGLGPARPAPARRTSASRRPDRAASPSPPRTG